MTMEGNNAEVSKVDVTFGCEALAPGESPTLESNWLVALVKVRSERSIVTAIEKMGYESFVPMQRELHQWKDRKKLVDRIITPSHVFFNIPQERYERLHFSSEEQYRYYKSKKQRELQGLHLPIRKLPNVHKILCMPASSEAAVIPEIQIKRFKFMVGMSDERVDIIPSLAKGDYVKVVRGKLKGLTGYISKLPNAKSLIAVAMYPMGYAVTGIAVEDVEPVKEPKL